MFNINTTFICVGLVVIIFIVSVSLLIFAPKSINYHTLETYPILKFIHENNLDTIQKDLESIENSTKWINWPDKEYIKGTCSVYPLFMFSTSSKSRKNECSETYKLMQNVPDMKSCAFIKIDKKSKIMKQNQWKELSNETLRGLFILKAVASATIDQCGIWVNGESKKLISKNLIIFDSSKEHSIYNDTDYPIYALLVDIKRPEKIPNGVSQREYSDELYDFVSDLNVLN